MMGKKKLTLLKHEAVCIADEIEFHWSRTGKVTKWERKRLVEIYAQWPLLKPFGSQLNLEPQCSA